MEKCCNFLHSFKGLRWTKTTLIICLLPFVLLMMVFILILICTVESLGAVVSNSRICAEVGGNILEIGGSATDAAIATMLCEGIALPNNAGIGGGFSAIMRIDGTMDSIEASPTFPSAIMRLRATNSKVLEGAQAAGIPGELMGYWEMHQRYGMLPWKKIIEPSIRLCREGIPMTEWLAGVLRYHADRIVQTPSMIKIFPWVENIKNVSGLTFPVLADTLQQIADHGVSVFYEGDVGKLFVEDIQRDGGFITQEDLKHYKVLWSKNLPSLRLLQRFKVITTPPPTSGAVIILILNVIKSLKLDPDSGIYWHHVLEAMKHSFGMSVNLGDAVNDPEYADYITKAYSQMSSLDFASEIRQLIRPDSVLSQVDYNHTDMDGILGRGSANICVLSPNGDIVAGTTSLLHQFGAFYCSESTGIIVNNLLHRFFGDVNKANRPLPYKHIVTAYNPVIVLDNLSKPYFIVGASGGARGIALIVSAIIRYVIFGESAFNAVNTEPLYAELYQNHIEFGDKTEISILRYLKTLGHNLYRRYLTYDNFTAATCIGHRNRRPTPQYNFQVGGSSRFVKPMHELGLVVVAIIAILCIAVFGLILYEVLHPKKATSFSVN